MENGQYFPEMVIRLIKTKNVQLTFKFVSFFHVRMDMIVRMNDQIINTGQYRYILVNSNSLLPPKKCRKD